MVRSQPARTNESRESRFKNLADLEAAYRRVADDPSTESCVVDVPNRMLYVHPESEVRQPPPPPNLHLDRRREPRALVCARVFVMANGEATEHMTYDLSVGGVRLCGLPRAQVGDEVSVLLQLPWARVRAQGRLLRRGSIDGRPDFAIQFVDLEANDEDAIQDAMVDALSHPERRSLLLLQREEGFNSPACFAWLNPVSAISATAATSLEGVRCLEKHPIDMGILSSAGYAVQDSEWSEEHPEVSWRSIDYAGRLHPVTTTFGLRVV